ncbi:PQQ-binding-like beta-propeller repeat protein [Sulfurimonas sp. HSL-1716]|uniref:outer membrane protein assembly factor BamB family protein n=1 Tax=Hydrocurvibacter sulfurireducens TaxID=3131937 RepID=UPI0031F8DF75
MKKFLFIVLFTGTLFARSILNPCLTYTATGGVTDMVIHDGKLYVGTTQSSLDIFDMRNDKLLKTIKVDKVKDFMGDLVDAKIYSVDVDKDRLLILSEAEHGYRRVYINEDGKNKIVIPSSMSLSIEKAKFLDKDTILLGLLGDELISYDIKKGKQNWRVPAGGSKFSDFALNERKDRVVVADESGDLKIIDTKNGALIKTLTGENLDNVFQVDYKKGIIVSAGQDRRTVIYNRNTNSAYYKSSDFMIYSVGLSPSGKLAGYSSDENGNVTIFNTATKTEIGTFGGNKMTPAHIIFINENEFLVSSNNKIINIYEIK